MGATRKLALVVVVGLIAISTAITVYTANEPNRREEVTGNQQGLSIERAGSLYVTYCLQCHGPAGLGNLEEDADGNNMGRTGAALNQSNFSAEDLENVRAIYQSEDPVEQGIAEDWVRFRILYGVPSEQQLTRGFEGTPLMPSFRFDLNVEEINNLVWLVLHGDWNYVYNYSVHQAGLEVCEATPTAERTDMCEGDMENAVAYPTVPSDDPADEVPVDDPGPEDEIGPSDDADPDAANGGEHEVSATDNAFDVNNIVAQPGDTIILTNDGFAQHDIVVDELGMDSGLANGGETVTVTIPDDAEAGEYEFYCSVPGHREAGMVGTLTIEATDADEGP